MVISYAMFEYDEAKSASNNEKHGIGFLEALGSVDIHINQQNEATK